MKKMRQALALLLSVAMITGLTACGGAGNKNDSTGSNNQGTEQDATNDGSAQESTSQYNTLVIGTQTFDGVFSPFFYTSAYDAQVNDLIFASVCR